MAEYKLDHKRVSFGNQGASNNQSAFTPQKDNQISRTSYTPLASTAEPGFRLNPNYSDIAASSNVKKNLSRYNSPLVKKNGQVLTRNMQARGISNFDLPVHRAGKKKVDGKHVTDNNIFNLENLINLRGRGNTQPSQQAAPVRTIARSSSYINIKEKPGRRHLPNAPHFKSTVFQHEHQMERANTGRFLTTYQLTARSMSPLVENKGYWFEEELQQKDRELHNLRLTPGRTKLNNLNSKNWSTLNLSEKCGVANMYQHLQRQAAPQRGSRLTQNKSFSQLEAPTSAQHEAYDKFLSKSALISPMRQESPERSYEVSQQNSPTHNQSFHSASANNLMSFNTPDRKPKMLAYQSERDAAQNIVRENQQWQQKNGVKIDNGGLKKKLTTANYLNPTKIKPEWLLAKEKDEEDKSIRESVSTSMLLNPEHDKSYKRRFYEKLLAEEEKVKRQLTSVKSTSEKAKSQSMIAPQQIPSEVSDVTKRLDYDDNNFIDRMSGDPQRQRYSIMEMQRQKLRQLAGRSVIDGESQLIRKKEKLAGLPSGLSPVHKKKMQEAAPGEQVKLPCTSLDVGEVTSEMVESKRQQHHARLLRQIELERAQKMEQKMKKRQDDVKEKTHIEARNRTILAKQSYIEQLKKEELKMFIQHQKREKADQYMHKLRAKAKQTQAAKEQAIKNEQTEKEIKQMHKAMTMKVAEIQKAQMSLKVENNEAKKSLERALTSPLKK